MGISKHDLSRVLRAALACGLLGGASVVFSGSAAMAQDCSSDVGATDTSTDSTDSTDSTSDGSSDGASDGTSDGASDGASDGSDVSAQAAVRAVAFQQDCTTTTSGGTLASTGGDVAVPLALGGAALSIVLVGRRFLGAQH